MEEDEDDEAVVYTSMLEYSKLILLSGAYNWLIANLLKQTISLGPVAPAYYDRRGPTSNSS